MQTEHSTYLSQFTDNDSVFYFHAKNYLRLKEDSLFLINFFKSQRICTKDTSLLRVASLAFLSPQISNSNKTLWFEFISNETNNNSLFKVNTYYLASVKPASVPPNLFPEEIKRSFLKYKKADGKSPFLAATLSVILPGAGKMYAGKTRSGLMNLLMNAGYAAQTAESYYRLGVSHPFTIVNATVFSVFYLANIYGSYRSVQSLKKEYKDQFLRDAVFYN